MRGQALLEHQQARRIARRQLATPTRVLSHAFSPRQGLGRGAPRLQRTYRGQEGIQEAAGKDSASGKGRAEVQAHSREVSFHPTELFNKVHVGRIFCK